MGHVEYHFAFALFNLSVCGELGEVFLGDSVLDHHVQGDNADLIVVGHRRVEQDWDDIAHVILDLFALGVSSHGKVLFNATQLVDVSLGERERESFATTNTKNFYSNPT
jgi:hypothetical protein